MAAMTEAAKREVLAATPLFAALSRDELAALAGLAKERRVARDALAVRRGDTDASVQIVVTGRLRVGSISTDGRELIIDIMGPGDVIGEIALLDGQPRSKDVAAMVDSTLLVVERPAFLPFLRARPELMLRLMALLCSRLRKAGDAFEDVALSSLSKRLARFVLDMAKQHGAAAPEGTIIRLKITQKDMSAHVAGTRERVNKQLRQWQEAGTLGTQDGYIVVRRPAELRALLDAAD